jgi:hypothetical protein
LRRQINASLHAFRLISNNEAWSSVFRKDCTIITIIVHAAVSCETGAAHHIISLSLVSGGTSGMHAVKRPKMNMALRQQEPIRIAKQNCESSLSARIIIPTRK